jgi:hypothetical protein
MKATYYLSLPLPLLLMNGGEKPKKKIHLNLLIVYGIWDVYDFEEGIIEADSEGNFTYLSLSFSHY